MNATITKKSCNYIPSLFAEVEKSCFESLPIISDILAAGVEYTAKQIDSLIKRCYIDRLERYAHQKAIYEYKDEKGRYEWTNLTCYRLYYQLASIERKRTKRFILK